MGTLFLLVIICIILAILCKFYTYCHSLAGGDYLFAVVFGICLLTFIHTILSIYAPWYPPKVTTPQIELSVNSSWLANSQPVTELGETLTEKDGKYYITLTDHRIESNSTSNAPDITITLTPSAALLKKAQPTLEITKQTFDHKTENISKNYSALAKTATYTIEGRNLPLSTESEDRPTTYTIRAQNRTGTTEKVLIVRIISLERACNDYATSHDGDSSNITICRKQTEAKQTKNQASNTSPSLTTPTTQSTTSTPTTNSSSSSTSRCLHYEAGRCWDDLEMEAYSQGQYDKQYGSYGDSYYGDDNCDELCEAILEDAYEEGYDDY